MSDDGIKHGNRSAIHKEFRQPHLKHFYRTAWAAYSRTNPAPHWNNATTTLCRRNYVARGIKFEFPSVLDMARYLKDYLGPRPDDHSLDRIDNNDGYRPGNLRWATPEQQRFNSRAPHLPVTIYRSKPVPTP